MDFIQDVQHLIDIKHCFDDLGDNAKVDLHTFLGKITPLMGGIKDAKTMTDFFQKIDIDAEGEIGWDQFSDFVSTARAQSQDDQAEKSNDWRVIGSTVHRDQLPPISVESAHADFVDRAIYLGALDKYITCSRDGSWKVWNGGNLQHHKTIRYNSADSAVSTLDRWILDACYIAEWKKLAVLCHDSTISFYEVGAGGSKNFEKILTIPFTEHGLGSPTCCSSARIHGDEYLLIGTSMGQVVVLRPSILDVGKRVPPAARKGYTASAAGAASAAAAPASPSKRALMPKASFLARPNGLRAKLGANGEAEPPGRIGRSHSLAAAVKLLQNMDDEEMLEKKAAEVKRAQQELAEKRRAERAARSAAVASSRRSTAASGNDPGRNKRASLSGRDEAVETRASTADGRASEDPDSDLDDVGFTLPNAHAATPSVQGNGGQKGTGGRRSSGGGGRRSSNASVQGPNGRLSITSMDPNLQSTARRRFGTQHSGDGPPMEVLFSNHMDWVTQILYEDETHMIVTSSLDGTISVFDTESLSVKSVYHQHRLGVKGMVFSPSLGVIASYGLEREVHLWLLRSGVKVAQLTGFSSSIVSCAINDEMQHLYSVTVDHAVRVHDLKNQKLLQTLTEEMFERPEDRKANFLLYDPRSTRLLSFYNRPHPWHLQCVSHDSLGHTAPVSAVLYNPLFGSMITADESGTVVVWDSKTSRPLNRFERTHDGKGITAMTLDVTRRKLITAATDTRIRVWNFNNGILLKEFVQFEAPFHTTEVLHAVDERRGIQRMLATGWGGKVYAWEEKAHVSVVDEYKPLEGHREDVLSLSYSKETNTVVTGDYEGRILIWSFITMTRSRSITHWLAPTPLANAAESLVFLPPVSAYFQRIRMAEALVDPREHMESEADLAVMPSSRSALGVDFESSVMMSTSSMLHVPAADADGKASHEALGPHALEIRNSMDGIGAGARASTFGTFDSRSSEIGLHPSSSMQASSSSRSAVLISCMGDGRMLLWDMKNTASKVKAVIRVAHGKFDTVSMIKVDRDLKFLATGDSAGCVKIWDLREIYKYMSNPSPAMATECLRPLYHFMTQPEVISALEIFSVGAGTSVQEFVAVTHGDVTGFIYTIEGRLVGALREKARFSLQDESTWEESHAQAAERRATADEREARQIENSWNGDPHVIESVDLDSHKGGPLGRKNSIVGTVWWAEAPKQPAAAGRTPLDALSPTSRSALRASAPIPATASAAPARASAPAPLARTPMSTLVRGQATLLPSNALQLLGLIKSASFQRAIPEMGLEEEDSFLSKLSDAESELTAILGTSVADGHSISQAVLNLKKVLRSHGIAVFPGTDQQGLNPVHDQPVGSHYDRNSIHASNICLSTLHRALDCYVPEKVPENVRDLKRLLNAAPKVVPDRAPGRPVESEEASPTARSRTPPPQPSLERLMSITQPGSAPDRLDQILENSLPPLPFPNRTGARFADLKSRPRMSRSSIGGGGGGGGTHVGKNLGPVLDDVDGALNRPDSLALGLAVATAAGKLTSRSRNQGMALGPAQNQLPTSPARKVSLVRGVSGGTSMKDVDGSPLN